MDQSTQVDFFAMPEHSRQKLQRYDTLGDVRLPTYHVNSRSTSSVKFRPRSLNLSIETSQKNRSNHNLHEGNGTKLIYPYADEATSVVGVRTHAPAHHFNSSSVTDIYSQKHSYGQHLHNKPTSCDKANSQRTLDVSAWPCQISEGTPDMATCKCFVKTTSTAPSTTPEGLSWRRLHMSRAKLKGTSTTSELLSGFAMVAMVELQINENTAVPEWLFVMFSVCTTVLVAVHIFALMISTYILPNIDAISKLDICDLVSESPHERMKGFIELAWAFSTVLGLFLFLVEVAILCWVKFWDYSFTAAIAATIIVIPVLVIFVLFAVHFYHSLVVHKCDTSLSDMQKLEDMKKHLDEVTSPV